MRFLQLIGVTSAALLILWSIGAHNALPLFERSAFFMFQ